MGVSVIIPTLNAGEQLRPLLRALAGQSLRPQEILVVDSQSQDDTCSIAREEGARVLSISREAFDHGGTRDMALRRTAGEIVVFMTQDALPMDERFLERLAAPLADERIAAAGARQVAYPTASASEKLIRAHNYSAQSRVWAASDIARLGVRAFLISDVSAAYRREAYLAVGGFDHPLLTNEDMLICDKLMRAGYALAYAGDACVYHSHDFTWLQQFRRNRDIGIVLERYAHRFADSSEMGEGVALVRSVLTKLLKERRFAECIRFCWGCSARLLGNRLGRMSERRAKAKRVAVR